MPYKKGQSGNPNGRPPKSKALTDLLRAELNKTMPYNGGKRNTAKKRVIAALVADVLTTGEATLPNGESLKFSPRDWWHVVEWLHDRLDGKPTQKQEITGADGGPVKTVTYITENRSANTD